MREGTESTIDIIIPNEVGSERINEVYTKMLTFLEDEFGNNFAMSGDDGSDPGA